MNRINYEDVKKFLYNTEFDRKDVIDTIILSEIYRESNMNEEELKKNINIYGRTYTVQKATKIIGEYIRFIALNDERGNYEINRGFQFSMEMQNDLPKYSSYAKYIFEHINIPFNSEDFTKVEDNDYILDKFLLYKIISEHVMNRIKNFIDEYKVSRNQLSMNLTMYKPEYIMGKINGVDFYNEKPDDIKRFFNLLINIHELKYSNFNEYNILWHNVKYVRAEKRQDIEEMEKVKSGYQSFIAENFDTIGLQLLQKNQIIEPVIKKIYNGYPIANEQDYTY